MLDLRGKENLIFDLGGVLLNIDYGLTSKAFRELGFTTFDSFYSQKRQTKLFDLFETGKIESGVFVDAISKEVPGISKHDVVEAWNAMLLDLPEQRIELLRALKNHFHIILLSNTNQIHEDAFVTIVEEAYGTNVLMEVFDTVHLSHQIGYRKPTRACFDFVLEYSGIKAEKTLFIDDSIQHVEGAKTVGIDAFHMKEGKDVTQLFPDKFQRASHL